MNNEFVFEKLGALKINLLYLFAGTILIMLWETLYCAFYIYCVVHNPFLRCAQLCKLVVHLCCAKNMCSHVSPIIFAQHEFASGREIQRDSELGLRYDSNPTRMLW